MSTIAELQAHKEKLKAERARRDLDELLDSTCTRDDWKQAASQLSVMVDAALDELQDALLESIDGVGAEHAAHHHMTDASITVLKSLAEKVRAQAQPDWAGRAMATSVKPRELLTVSAWADQNRVIETGSASPGPWRTDLTPYLREIMDSLSEHSPVRRVSFMKASGVGGSEVFFNWIGYLMDHVRNKDVLLTVPTLELRDRTLNPKLNKLFKETECLGNLVSGASRDKSNSASVTTFGDMARLIKAGANSPDSFRADHLPYAASDEVDAYPWDLGKEGNPLDLIENRQRTYTRAKTYNVSTPTLDLLSLIQVLFLAGDQRYYNIHCPHCGFRQTFEFARFEWDLAPGTENDGVDAVVIKAFVVCANSDCAAPIYENHKTDMLAGGLWIPKRPHIKDHRSYQLNSLYAPIGLGLTWVKIAQKIVQAGNDTAKKKVIRNTYEGLPWKDEGEEVDSDALAQRLESYSLDDLIDAGVIDRITAGADVQKNRIETTYVAWNRHEEAWLLGHRIYPGDPKQDDCWDAMYEECAEMSVSLLCVDSGYLTSRVIEKTEGKRWSVPIKGMSGFSRPVVEDKDSRVKRLRKRSKNAHALEPVGVDAGKEIIQQRLQQKMVGAGYIHFPNHPDFDQEYFDQLGAEQLATKLVNGRKRREFVELRARNEALDCLNYAYAAMCLLDELNFLLRPLKSRQPHQAAALPPKPAPTADTNAADTPEPKPQAAPARRRRTVTSSYARR